MRRKVFAGIVVLAFFSVSTQASFGQSRIAAFVIDQLSGPISNAVQDSADVDDAGPFVDSVVAFLREDEEEAAAYFVSGLVVNSVEDPAEVNEILDSIAGISGVASLAFLATGNRELSVRLSRFNRGLRGAPVLEEWREAQERGDDVRIEDGEVVIVETRESDEDEQDVVAATEDTPTYVQQRDDEVLPLLNIVHGREGADVLVDGDKVDESEYEEYMFDEDVLGPGLREITIRDELYESTLMVFVNPGRETESNFDQIELQMERGYFDLEVAPNIDGLDVYVDGAQVGKTPVSAQVRAGERNVEIRGEWVESYETSIEGNVDDNERLEPELVARGALRISQDVPGSAHITIDGESREVSYSRTYLEPGTYEVEISEPDGRFRSISDEITIEPGQSTVLSPNIEYRTGTLGVSGVPPDTQVLLDGEEMELDRADDGTMEAEVDEAVIGERIIAFTAPYLDEPSLERTVVSEDETTHVSAPTGMLELTEIPPTSEVALFSESSDSQHETVTSDGGTLVLPVIASDIDVEITGEFVLEPYRATVEIEPGETVSPEVDIEPAGVLELELVLPRTSEYEFATLEVESGYEYRIYPADDTDPPAFTEVSTETESIRELLPAQDYVIEGRRANDDSLGLQQRITVEPWANTSVQGRIERTRSVQILELERELARTSTELKPGRRARTIRRIAFGLGIGSATLAVVSHTQSQNALDSYEQASTSAGAQEYRETAERWRGIRNISAGTALGSFGIGTTTFLWRSAEDEPWLRRIAFGLAMGTAGSGVYSYFQANNAHDSYEQAQTTAEAAKFRRETAQWDLATWSSFGVSAASLAVSGLTYTRGGALRETLTLERDIERHLEELYEE